MSLDRKFFACLMVTVVCITHSAALMADTVKFVSWGEFSHPGVGVPGSGMSVSNSHSTSSVSVGDLSLLFTGVNATLEITDAGNSVLHDNILGLPAVQFGMFSLPNSAGRPHETWGRLNGTEFTLFVTQIEPNPFPYLDTGSLQAQVKGTFVVTRDSTTQLNYLEVMFQTPNYFQIPEGRGYPPAIKYVLPEKVRVTQLDNSPNTSAPQGAPLVGSVESVPAPLPPTAVAGLALFGIAALVRRTFRGQAAV
jgi:hypothetical protein